jgi:large subunit ribosomal protein L15
MSILSNLKYAEGSRKKRKRIGRGQGSGYGGHTSTKGHKGQKSRSGYKSRAWFEGGQMPIQRRVPKFGFKNVNRKEFSVLNVGQLQKLIDSGKISDATIDKDFLVKMRLISKTLPLKILGNGDIKTKIEITANAFSDSAKEKIEKAGGVVKTV